jgi:hypothetical protein
MANPGFAARRAFEQFDAQLITSVSDNEETRMDVFPNPPRTGCLLWISRVFMIFQYQYGPAVE